MKLFLVVFFIMISAGVYGQLDTISPIKMDEVIVKAVRLPEKAIHLPVSISLLSFKNSQDSRQQLSLNEYLMHVPGLFALNANNFAQDLRVSIRGFGARAAFGIRGVKIIVDGIPETTPDGQGQIDNLNLGIIDNIEVIRGPASSLYGNASGGIINIQTTKQIQNDFIQSGFTFGTYNMQKYQLLAGVKLKKTDVILLGNHTTSDGFRERSGFESTNFNARVFHHFSKKSALNWNVNFANSPKAEDAGGLKLEDVVEDRQQARDRNVAFKTGETINQVRLALNYEYKNTNSQVFKIYGFYATRNFNGKLPFEYGGIINLKRNYFGHGSSYQFNQKLGKGKNKVQLGYEMAFQKDNRSRFQNLEGNQGNLTFEQLEQFTNVGIYLIDHFNVGKWHLNGGLRFDWNILEATDRLLSNGNNSGSLNLQSINPSIGISYTIKKNQSIYTNFSTSFETPSLSELSANPTGDEGLNSKLEAQKSRNYELGWKAHFKNHFDVGVAIFHIDTDNEIVPFELEAFPDRTFFQNSGSSKRDGFEFEMAYQIRPYWKLNSSYTFSAFKYDEFKTPKGDYSENQLPGIPKHMASLTLQYVNKKGLSFQFNSSYNGSLYTNNSNTTKIDDYLILNTNMSYKFQIKKLSFTPFFGINNLLNTEYNDNIRINAFGSRFYEPAPKINFYGGVKIRLY